MHVAALKILRDGSEEQVISFEEVREFVIGRGEYADLQLTDPKVDFKHCKIYRVDHIRGRQYYIHSLNGTRAVMINGAYCNNALLRYGDRIQIGDTHLFLIEEEVARTKPLDKRFLRERTEALPAPAQALPAQIASPPPSWQAELQAARVQIENLQKDLKDSCEKHDRGIAMLRNERDSLMAERNRLREKPKKPRRETSIEDKKRNKLVSELLEEVEQLNEELDAARQQSKKRRL